MSPARSHPEKYAQIPGIRERAIKQMGTGMLKAVTQERVKNQQLTGNLPVVSVNG